MTDTGELLWDRSDPDFLRDPYSRYRELSEAGPVHRGELGELVLTRWADCHAVLRDPRFSSDPRHRADGLGRRNAEDGNRSGPATILEAGVSVMLFLDPPDHTRLRRLVASAFTPRAVDALAPRIAELVEGLLDEVAGAGTFDVMDALAYPLPVIVICELLGVPAEDREQFKGWSSDATRLLDLADADGEAVQRGLAAGAALLQYLFGLIEDHRANPRDDLLSAMIAAEEEGDRLTPQELYATCMLLFLAGHETTMNLIGNGVLALLRHPDQHQRLLDDPGLIPGAVEEILRFDPPVQVTARTATVDGLEVAGRPVARGQGVVTAIAAANRDPEQFPDPDRFDVTRPEARHHLAFGGGIHYCLGAPLARLEGRIVLERLLARFPRLEPDFDLDRPEYREHFVLRGLRTLPVRPA